MRTIHEPEELQRLALEARASGKRVGLVPTMGNLHTGHASLIDIARREADVVIVSVFVNPTQFGPNEDYEKYPRTLEADKKVCEAHGADIVFAPTPTAIYARDASTFVEENSCSQGLCGRYRPTHFRGVCTVVNLLFNLAQPTVAVFGQKDAQQAAVLKRMVRDLHIPVKIIVAPIVREADNLALSSRNQYLSKKEREAAPKIFAALSNVAKKFANQEVETEVLRKELDAKLRESEILEPQYVEIVDSETMQPLKKTQAGQTLIAVAVYTAETRTRLIDNIVI